MTSSDAKQLTLKDKKAWSVHIYCMGMTSFKFSNCVEKNDAMPTFSAQFEDGVTSHPCNKYEQITTSYTLSVLELTYLKPEKK